jgi:uncharacterized iron-regulated protein
VISLLFVAATVVIPLGLEPARPASAAAAALPVLAQAGAQDARPTAPEPAPSYVPQRVYDARRKRFTDFETMIAEIARADVVFVGEQHDDANTHRLELALLEGLARRRRPVVLALEMFERDVQAVVDAYLAGRVSEEAFLAQARPWPRYRSDYRPLVEFARAHGWPVVAANVPRQLANEVSKSGLASLAALADGARGLAAQVLACPFDRYFDRFAQSMREHPGPGAKDQSPDEARRATERFYFAQCLKDETMAESVAEAVARHADARRLVVHVNGAFHSDYRQGAVARTLRRLPRAAVKVVTIVPVDDLDRLAPTRDDRKRADYLVYTLKTPPRRLVVAAGL